MNNINKDSRKRRSLPGLIEFILALSMLAMGGSPVLISQFIYELTSEKYNFNDNGASACSNDTNSTTLQETVQTESSHFMMYINIATMAPSILMTIFLGAFSDINGRKISIVISISCAGLAFFAYDIFIFFRISRKYFVLPGLIQGLGGGWIALYMATFSYLSDTTSIETRSFRVTLMEAAAGVTVTLSQIIMGLAIKKLGYLYSFLIIQGILAISLIITVVFLEDVIRVTPNVKRGLFSYIKATFHVYTKPSECGRRWRLLLILVILFMVAFVNLGRIDVITYLLKDSPFCWKSDYIGYYMGTSTCMTYTSSLIFTKLTGKIFGDKGLMMIGAISGIASNLLLGFAQSLSLLIAGLFANIFTSLVIPMVRSIGSKLVSSDEKGAMFAGIACIETISTLSGLVSMDAIYMVTVNIFKPTAFIVCSGILSICLFTICGYIWREKRLSRLEPQPL